MNRAIAIVVAGIGLATPAFGDFSDGFDDGDYDGWTVRWGTWDASTGRLAHIANDSTGNCAGATIYTHAGVNLPGIAGDSIS